MTTFTTTQLNAIKSAIASGTLSVMYEGKSVTYRSMSDLKMAKEMIEAELIAAGTLAAPVTIQSSIAQRVR